MLTDFHNGASIRTACTPMLVSSVWVTISQGKQLTHDSVWTAFEQEGLGANLQHYNPLIDQQVVKEWGIPAHWVLKSQLVFGKPAAGAQPMDKTFKPLEERVKLYGGKFTKN